MAKSYFIKHIKGYYIYIGDLIQHFDFTDESRSLDKETLLTDLNTLEKLDYDMFELSIEVHDSNEIQVISIVDFLTNTQ